MTAPDQVAKTSLKPFASGGRPHMISSLAEDRVRLSFERVHGDGTEKTAH